MSNLEEWAAIARTFHTLQDAPGVSEGREPSPRDLNEWACTQEPYDGVREAAQFALHTWAGTPGAWSCGDFNLRGARGAWDREQQRAFLRWVMAGGQFF